MTNIKNIKRSERGFTLVELAIVLVIIGLIIGGVLVGQDLIKAAEIRATVSQIEKYNAAVNTFRTRFNGLPGDIRNAGDFGGILTVTHVGTAGLGDGDGLLQSTGGANILTISGEIAMFWSDLSDANLVDGAYTIANPAGVAAYAVGTQIPRAKIDRSGISVYFVDGYNYYQIGAQDGANSTAVFAGSLTPNEAYNIDVKVDDGRPLTGQTWARGGTTPNQAYVVDTASSATTCATGADGTPDAADNYDLASENVTCQLRLRMN